MREGAALHLARDVVGERRAARARELVHGVEIRIEQARQLLHVAGSLDTVRVVVLPEKEADGGCGRHQRPPTGVVSLTVNAIAASLNRESAWAISNSTPIRAPRASVVLGSSRNTTSLQLRKRVMSSNAAVGVGSGIVSPG